MAKAGWKFGRPHASRGKSLQRGVASSLVAAFMVLPAVAAWTFDQRAFIPEVVQHLERARTMSDTGQTDLAVAHSRVILHDQGVRVYVDFSRAPANQLSDCQYALEEAIRYWNETLGSKAISLTEDSRQAEVRLEFKPDVLLNGVQVGGYCSQSWSVNSGVAEATAEYSSTISARTVWPGGRPMGRDYLRNIVTHEFGHVFGLNDSGEGGKLMSPLSATKPRLELSADEMEALRQFRLMALEVQRDSAARTKGN